MAMEIGFPEQFALADDRAQAVEQLVPGTEEYYRYACLQAEQAGALDRVRELLATWIARHGASDRTAEVEHRLALLDWERDPAACREHLRLELGLNFDHQREAERGQLTHPTVLRPELLGREALARLAFAERPNDLGGFTDRALGWLADTDLDERLRRALLARLTTPDAPHLCDHILLDLDARGSGGFGSLGIHGRLTAAQLDELAARRPALLENEAFVRGRVARLQPEPDADWEHDPEARQAYLERLWAFVDRLPPAFHSLKVHVLYHRLEHDRRRGRYDRELFRRYVALPRRAAYAEPRWLERPEVRHHLAALDADYAQATRLPPVGDDEALVRDYLERFFLEGEAHGAYAAWIHEGWLRAVAAEAHLLAGSPDPERWAALLDDPAAFQALKDRVELTFAPQNPTTFRADAPVTLEVLVKNVPTLVVKVFEIQAYNVYLATGRDVDTSLDLDGLVAADERTCAYDEPPLRRVRRTFALPALARPGVYVVELIGNGRSSRALVRKGGLRLVERVGAAGHVFTILDEDNRPAPDATLTLGGRELRADGEGEIRVPFSTSPGTATVLLRRGALCTVATFAHRAETHAFTAGVYVDRESLVRGGVATVLVRPSLLVGGAPASLELLEETSLLIVSVDRAGATSTRELAPFPLAADREATATFQVPDDLASLTFTVRAKIASLTSGRKVDLVDGRSFAVNGIDRTGETADLHLARTAAGAVLLHLGKSGEPRARVPVNVVVRHRDFTRALEVFLQTDDAGRIELGALDGVVEVAARTPSGVEQRWPLRRDRCRRPRRVHGPAGEPLRIPYPAGRLDRDDVALLELRAGLPLADRFDALALEDGFLVLPGDLPPGDYALHLKDEAAVLEVRLSAGRPEAGWLLGRRRLLEARAPAPLHVTAVEAGPEELVIRVAHASPRARVHVVATRLVPAHSIFDELGRAPQDEPRLASAGPAPSFYLSGRDLGDEVRYVLERRFARPYAGCLLERPGLLLNPWAVRTTETTVAHAAAGTAYASCGAPPPACAAPAPSAQPAEAAGAGGPGFSNLDFVPRPSVVLANLRPDDDGVVRVPRADLGGAHVVRVLAADDGATVQREVALPEAPIGPRDLRFADALDAGAHFTQRHEVSVLAAGEALPIPDVGTARVEPYDTLGRVFGLLRSLSGNERLDRFSWLLRWPELDDAERRARLSEHACHEVHFFLSRKDPAFFAEVVRPYLAHKRHKTFLDHYLLDDDLSPYLRPWAHGRLNVAERILLARRIAGEDGPTARHVGDLCDLLPADPERDERIFRTALAGSALEAGDALGLAAAAAAAREEEVDAFAADEAPASRLSGGRGGAMPPPPPPAAPPAPGGPPPPSPRAAARQAAAPAPARAPASPQRAKQAARRSREDAADKAAREVTRALYQNPAQTQEWAETHYHGLRLEEQGPELVPANAFWRDFAAHRGDGPFLSPHVARATSSFAEMMLALAVLDLPFQASERPQLAAEGRRATLTAAGPTLVFHRQLRPAGPVDPARAPILVGQNYLRADDRTSWDGPEPTDRYTTDFLVGTVFVCRVALTNPTSSRQKLDVLLQLPRGAIPVSDGFVTRSLHVRLEPYATQSIEYAFYFPAPGRFPHFPVHAARNEALVAAAPPAVLEVNLEPTVVDTTSWAWVSQHGQPDDVLRFLEEANVERLDLGRIAWRLRDAGFYARALAQLERRHAYHDTAWSYSLHHGDLPRLREYLLHHPDLLRRCGPALESPVVTIDPEALGFHEHLEYAPLVNARAHRLGDRRRILNDRLAAQVQRFLEVLAHRPRLDDDDWLAVAYYLLLQDRHEEGIAAFRRVRRDRIAARLQYDYAAAWIAFLEERPDEARRLAEPWRDHPVDRWRNRFRAVLAALDEAAGAGATVVDPEDRAQRQAQLAATEPALDLAIEGRTVTLTAQNLGECRVSYYPMDVELLFSRQPFVKEQVERFSFIAPRRSDVVALPPGQTAHTLELPPELATMNVVVEATAGGLRRAAARFANDLLVQVIEGYGQVRVATRSTSRPVARAYVKAYARLAGGAVRFFKDGYTDLRGRFDYASLSTPDLDAVERFALLVLHDEHGAVIREAAPPPR